MLNCFIRIDDVGDWRIDGEYLRPLMDYLIPREIAVNLEVIPLRLSDETREYLRGLKSSFPDLVEIDQHGYSHELSEFSHLANFDTQLEYLRKGAEIFHAAFHFSPQVFTPPEHIYTLDTLMALNDLKFKIFSRQIKPSWDGVVFYKIGRMLKKYVLCGKRVSYHNTLIPNTTLTELSISIETSQRNKIKSVASIKAELSKAKRYVNPIGILVHHELMKEKSNMQYMLNMIDYLSRVDDMTYLTFERILANGLN